ncbi:TIGR00725 family protein [Thermodesulfobacteriota bacterium]
MGWPEYVGVIGAGACSEAVFEFARELGFEIGKRGWVLICGGLGGVMEGAAKGCVEANGTTIGILPGLDRRSANPYITIPIPTGLADGRNLLVVRASDILVSVAGGYGTLSEIGLALKIDRPVIGLETWRDIKGVRYVSDVKEAILTIEEIGSRNIHKL